MALGAAAAQTQSAPKKSHAPQPDLPATVKALEADFDKALLDQKMVGMSVTIIHDQDVLLNRGFGFADLEKKIPADNKTVYRIGSVTKVFTAVMLMQLRDAGKLQLDDPIARFVPEFKIKSRFPDARPATFRQVAAHYSGLPIEPPLPHEYQRSNDFPPIEEQLKSLSRVEMIVPAMSEFTYSNLGYNIMGLALSRAARQPYDKYVKRRILAPLRMDLTGVALTPPMKEHFAKGYNAADSAGNWTESEYPNHGVASGMMCSNTTDLAEFVKLFFREGPAGGQQVLGSSSIREMMAPVQVATQHGSMWQAGSAIGFAVGPFSGEQIDYKPGGTAGFRAFLALNYQKKIGFVILTNTDVDPARIAITSMTKLARAVDQWDEQLRTAKARQMLPRWKELAGTYVLEQRDAEKTLTFSKFVVSLKDDSLALSTPDLLPGSVVYMKEAPMDHYDGDTYHVVGGSFYGNFVAFKSVPGRGQILAWRGYTFRKEE